jgi:3-hydroxyisobutyrate dehydrogenase-like beta-hydroxyacid dehydrogenase
VGVIGLGNMGAALAGALLNAGHKVAVWNRTASKGAALVESGATAAASPGDVAKTSATTICCVTDHAASSDILERDGVATALAGKLLVQLTTMSADQSRSTADWARERGVAYLEGTILGLPQDVIGGSATIIYAGPKDHFDANKDLFSALGGSPQHLSEEIGAAVTFDRVYYAFAYGTLQAFIQGAALAHAKGFSVDAYTETAISRLPVLPSRLRQYGKMIAARDHADVQGGLDIFKDSFVETLEMCRNLGVDDTLPAALMANFRRASEAGYGEQEVTALFEVLVGQDR